MKKILSLLLVVAMVFVSGCGAATESQSLSQQSAESSNGEAPKEAESDNAAAYTGGAYELVFASNTGDTAFSNSAYGQAILKFIEETEKRSNGEIKITLYKGGALGSTVAELVGGVQQGSFEFTNWTTANLGEYTDAFMPFNIPFLFSDASQIHKLVDSELGEEMIQQVIDDTGMRILVWLDIGFRHMTNSKHPITSPDDVKGLKIRVQSDIYQIAAIEALGASATSIAYSELYAALQQKVVDGQENPLQNIMDTALYEVQNYLTLTSHIYGQGVLLMGNTQFESMSEEARQVLLDSAAVAQRFCREKSSAVENSLLETLKEKMEVTELSAEELEVFAKTAQTAWDKIAADFGQDALDRVVTIVEN